MKIKAVLVRLSEETHQQFKMKTVEQKTTIQEVLEKFINEYIADSDNDKR